MTSKQEEIAATSENLLCFVSKITFTKDDTLCRKIPVLLESSITKTFAYIRSWKWISLPEFFYNVFCTCKQMTNCSTAWDWESNARLL